MTTLDNLFRKYAISSVKLLKVDIEGGEYDAILGSETVFKQHLIDYIALELHPSQLHKQGKNAEDILHFLKRHGYTIEAQMPSLVLKSPFAQPKLK